MNYPRLNGLKKYQFLLFSWKSAPCINTLYTDYTMHQSSANCCTSDCLQELQFKGNKHGRKTVLRKSIHVMYTCFMLFVYSRHFLLSKCPDTISSVNMDEKWLLLCSSLFWETIHYVTWICFLWFMKMLKTFKHAWMPESGAKSISVRCTVCAPSTLDACTTNEEEWSSRQLIWWRMPVKVMFKLYFFDVNHKLIEKVLGHH